MAHRPSEYPRTTIDSNSTNRAANRDMLSIEAYITMTKRFQSWVYNLQSSITGCEKYLSSKSYYSLLLLITTS
jgi:hypothetical protein